MQLASRGRSYRERGGKGRRVGRGGGWEGEEGEREGKCETPEMPKVWDGNTSIL